MQCDIGGCDDTCVPMDHDGIMSHRRLMLTASSLGTTSVRFYAFDPVSCYVAQAGFEPTVPPGWPTSLCFGLHTTLSSVVCAAASLDDPGHACAAAGFLVPTRQRPQRH